VVSTGGVTMGVGVGDGGVTVTFTGGKVVCWVVGVTGEC
jgi:hypothetical protein